MLPPSEECTFVDTKLHEAVRYSDLEEVTDALQCGFDPNEIGAYLWSPLHEACNNGEQDIVRVLIQHGGDPSKADSLRGCTALHYAASLGHVECLQVLLRAGGKYEDVYNRDGKNCVDVAVGACLAILQKKREDKHCSLDKKDSALTESVKKKSTAADLPQIIQDDKTIKDDEDDSCDLDLISIATSASSSSSFPQSWSPTSVVGLTRNLGLGSALMSFEYNSKKAIFKVRVWQIEDFLLPPPETSKISRIYVKSYLHPDKSKNSKRKTEELPVNTAHETNAGDTPHTDSGTSVVFKPSCFKFCRPLEYTKVTKNTVETKVIEVMLCVVQKYTRLSFTVSSWTMPLQEAVRKLLKEKYTFKPCLSLNIPQNMKVYHAGGQLHVPWSSHGLSYSNPNLRRPASTGSWAMSHHERSVSDSDLQVVKTERILHSKASSIELTVEEEKEDERMEEALQEIAVMQSQEINNDTRVNMHNRLSGDKHSLSCVISQKCSAVADVVVHIPEEKPHPDKSKRFNRKNVEMLSRPETSSRDDPLTRVVTFCEIHQSFKPREVGEEVLTSSTSANSKEPKTVKLEKRDVHIEMTSSLPSKRKGRVLPADDIGEFAV